MGHYLTGPPSSRYLGALLALLLSVSFVQAQQFVTVKRVIDGDTIVLETGETVRLIGALNEEIEDLRHLGMDRAKWRPEIGQLDKKVTRFEEAHASTSSGELSLISQVF